MSDSKNDHHKRFELCRTRPQYRRSKRLTAVKVYTVANESKHLLIFGVPRVNLRREIKSKLQQFGKVQTMVCITDDIAKDPRVELEAFTDCFHVSFEKIENARRCKKLVDDNVFYGGILHVSYAPERETVDDLSEKLMQRKKEVQYRSKVFVKS